MHSNFCTQHCNQSQEEFLCIIFFYYANITKLILVSIKEILKVVSTSPEFISVEKTLLKDLFQILWSKQKSMLKHTESMRAYSIFSLNFLKILALDCFSPLILH